MNSEKKKQNLSRKKLINSAILLFADKGFDCTSTREICKHAGVNLSLIPYYFNNKEGLYISIIESIINYGLAFMQDELIKVEGISLLSKNEKIDVYKNILYKYTEFLYSENVPSNFVVLMIKEQASLHSKFSQTYAQRIGVLYRALRKTLASILNKNVADKTVVFEVSSIIGQILSFKILDRATLPYLNQNSYTTEDVKMIKKMIFAHIETSLEKLDIKPIKA
jgi:TetR/AcrR family transcriptional regulator, regulator of cefoperazone and chloramphenicol sensitivity